MTSSSHATFSSWLLFWITKIRDEEGKTNIRLLSFIGTLWATWKTKNDQVFRQIQATSEQISLHIADSSHQHSVFLQGQFHGLTSFRPDHSSRLHNSKYRGSINFRPTHLFSARWVVGQDLQDGGSGLDYLLSYHRGSFLYAYSAFLTEGIT